MFCITFKYRPCNVQQALLNNRVELSISGPMSNCLTVLFFIGAAFLQFYWLTFCAGISCFPSRATTSLEQITVPILNLFFIACFGHIFIKIMLKINRERN